MGTTTTQAWDFEGYWNTVLGANRSAADVVVEFKLVAEGLDEWLGTAEDAARSAGGLKECPEEWDAFHARALDRLGRVIAETEEYSVTDTRFD